MSSSEHAEHDKMSIAPRIQLSPADTHCERTSTKGSHLFGVLAAESDLDLTARADSCPKRVDSVAGDRRAESMMMRRQYNWEGVHGTERGWSN